MRVPASALLACLSFLAFAAPAYAQEAKPKTLYELMGVPEPGLRGAELEAAVKAAEPYPLGSQQNPVRTKGIAGQRAYLASLRCGDGKPPRVLGRGIGPPSPFGGVGDEYRVRCDGGEAVGIHMDMYHDWVELRAVPGFTIARS